MANVEGVRLTLSDTVGLAIDMSPTIELIDPFDVGLLSYIGMDSLDSPATAVKHEWMTDTLRPLTGTVNEAMDAVETDLDVTDGTILRRFDLIKVDDELMLVTAVAGNTATVVRGYSGSTAAVHANQVAYEILAPLAVEGGDAGTARSTVKTGAYNYRQIFEDVVQVSSTLEAIEQWAPGSEYARQLMKTMRVLFIQMDKSLIHGKPYIGTATQPGTMGGLLHYITSNVVAAAGAQLSEALYRELLTGIYDEGGNPDVFVMSLRQKQAQNLFLDAARRTGFEQRVAGSIVDSFMWEQGVVDTVIDRWMPQDMVFALERDYIGMGPVAGQTLGHEILPKDSRLRQKGQITGEYTVEVKNEAAHGYIDGLATTIVG